MTKVQLAKLTIEINQLKREAKRLEKKADSDDSRYVSALATKGSELVGPPQSIAIHRNAAKEFRKKAEFLESVRRGEASPDDLPVLKNRITEIDNEVEALLKEKGIVYTRMFFVRYLAGVIK